MIPRRSADNNSEPAAAPSDPTPTSTAAATTPAGRITVLKIDQKQATILEKKLNYRYRLAAAAGPATAANTAAWCSCRTSRR